MSATAGALKPAQSFDRYSRHADLTIRGDDWFRSYDEKTYHSAACGSEALRDGCLRMFRRFEIAHSLPPGFGQEIILRGYR